MKTLYLDCSMGAAGDMLTAALLELVEDQDACLKKLNDLSIPGVVYVKERMEKCGIQGTHITVKVNGQEESEQMHAHHRHEHSHDHSHSHHHDHHHTHEHNHYHTHEHTHVGMHEITHIVEDLAVCEQVKADILAVYKLIGEAESIAHGREIHEIHFHEVGTMDAIADVTAVCLLMEELHPDQVVVSPVHVGSGQVKCAHGILPVPAPATAYILKDVPMYSGKILGELCTPTGAALLKHFATTFGSMPMMRTTAIGYGMGKKDFEAANCVRAMLGETEDAGDRIVELACNLDDMTPEAVAFAQEELFAAGALDVYTVSAQMKKGRPGLVLYVMCKEESKEQIISLIFRHTTTLGIRENISKRHVLKRQVETVDTCYGPIRRKVSTGYGITREKYEYEDLARIARKEQLSIEEVKKKLM